MRTGGRVGVTLLAVLGGAFAPPPDRPVVPIAALGLVALMVGVVLAAAPVAADRATGRINVLEALPER